MEEDVSRAMKDFQDETMHSLQYIPIPQTQKQKKLIIETETFSYFKVYANYIVASIYVS